MDLIRWSLNAIDTIFSTRSHGAGEPTCPDGTSSAGYVHDSWGTWRSLCLAPLSLEDVEDVYLFGTLIAVALLIGLGVALVYRKTERVESAIERPRQVPHMIDAVGRAVGTQTVTVGKSLETIVDGINALRAKLDQLGDSRL